MNDGCSRGSGWLVRMTGARGAGAFRRQGLRGATRALRGYTGHELRLAVWWALGWMG